MNGNNMNVQYAEERSETHAHKRCVHTAAGPMAGEWEVEKVNAQQALPVGCTSSRHTSTKRGGMGRVRGGEGGGEAPLGCTGMHTGVHSVVAMPICDDRLGVLRLLLCLHHLADATLHLLSV